MKTSNFLFKKIDNAQLIVFRVFYGVLICFESFGGLANGWVRKTFVEPLFTFSFIGFEWLQPLPGNGMYAYFAIMGICGLLIIIGYEYRLSAFTFAFLWTGVYLMQKSAYNNHYYLLMLLAFIMAFLPANRDFSIDAKRNPSIRSNEMSNYIRWIIILQLFIVYTYASVAKLYAGWFEGSFIKIAMEAKKDYFLIGGLLQEPLLQKCITVFGLAFDLLVVPALLWKPTRKIALGLSIFFHLFNSFVFKIGIFPYLALAFLVFFFEPETIRRIFLRRPKNNEVEPVPVVASKANKIMVGVLCAYFVVQILLPLRHHVIPGKVVWTEEGHRLSWRMMLRSRKGHIQFKVVDKATNEETLVEHERYLTTYQKNHLVAFPDFIWQYAQRLKKQYQSQGKDVAVYAIGQVRVNDGDYHTLIDPTVDLASVPWKHLSHNEWILIPEEYQ